MQIVGANSRAEVVGAQAQQSLRNVHLTTMTATDQPNVTDLSTLYLAFDVAPDHPYGGHRTSSRWVDGRSTGVGIRAFDQDADERRAAQAVLDAITASGLLTATLPVNDWQRPEAGRTRLYLDRRSRFLEFETGKAPASAQPVLDALAAYELVARRGAQRAA